MLNQLWGIEELDEHGQEERWVRSNVVRLRQRKSVQWCALTLLELARKAAQKE